MTVVDESGTPLVWRAHYWRHYVERIQECESLEEAARFLTYGEDEGSLSACCVVEPEGTSREHSFRHERTSTPDLSDERRPKCPRWGDPS